MAFASLETMPAELGLMILQQLSSPKYVYSTIRASRVFYSIFTVNKYLVLAATVQRAIPPQALPVALAACNAVKISPYPCWESETDTDADHPSPNFRGLSVSVPLCRLWAVQDFFVAGYARRALGKMQASMKERMLSSRDGDMSRLGRMQSLPESEIGRLQRAFFRFEVYRKQFRGFDLLGRITKEHRLFMKKLQPWELEELNAIYEYLVRLVEDLYDDLEDKIFTAVQNAANNDKTSLVIDYTTPGELEDVGFQTFTRSHKPRQADNIAFVIELGLPFLKRLFEMSKPEQIAIVTSFHETRSTPPLEDVIKRMWYRLGHNNPPYRRHNHLSSSENGQKAQEEPNAFWLWRTASMHGHELYEEYGLRELGYIPWDKDRLDGAGLAELSWEDLGPLPKLRDRAKEMSVEKRLKGTKITHRALALLKPRSWQWVARRKCLQDFEY